MMPIFFHAQAHIWIAYALFVNGLLLNRLLLDYSTSYRHLCQTFEAQIITSFGFCLGLNGLVLLALDSLGLPFSLAIYALLAFTALGLLVCFKRGLHSSWPITIHRWAVALYVLLFAVLFYNGGLIDQISDAWWHMSFANQIGWANSFDLQYGHLTGASERYYPPLWHGNLALLRELSGQGLPAIWNAFTAWGGVLKVMAYYVLGLGLFKNRNIAFMGALLFTLLPGLGNSYMRVSAWPSHLSYVFLFFSLFVTFTLFDVVSKAATFKEAVSQSVGQYVAISVLLLATVLMFLLHQFEVLLFLTAVFLFLMGASIGTKFSTEQGLARTTEFNAFFQWLYRLGLFILLAVSVHHFIQNGFGTTNIDTLLSITCPIILLTLLLVVNMMPAAFKKTVIAILCISTVGVMLSINYQHLASLFVSDLALPNGSSGERPMIADGWFGGELGVPGWHLQLRAGLLWSGVVGGVISIGMAIFRPSRPWYFLAANSIFAWLLCASPYFYQWLTDLLKYHSVWRFAMLSFHPLALAAVWVLLAQACFGNGSEPHKTSVQHQPVNA